MMVKWRRLSLTVLKCLGFFHLSSAITKNDVRILCYHGVSMDDEHRFNGLLFMTCETFFDRMKYLRNNRFNVVSLETALDIACGKRAMKHPVVITFDDGWFNTYKNSVGILKEYGFPATIYVTSYYACKRVSVLNVVVRYLAWKSNRDHVDMAWLSPNLGHQLPLDKGSKKTTVDRIINELENIPTLSERKEAVERISEYLGFSREDVTKNPAFHLMTERQIRQAAEEGFSIQLHTHRHRFPSEDLNALRNEIEENRKFLEPLIGYSPVHLCYPSGRYDPRCYDMLRKMKIKSATTCESGFMKKKSHVLALPRFLDGENIEKIEFEAELCGALEILRRLRSKIINLLSAKTITCFGRPG